MPTPSTVYYRRARFRNNLAAILRAAFPAEKLETCIVPDHSREEIAALPNRRLIFVRNGTQSIDASEGDVGDRQCVFEVGVAGALSPLKAGGSSSEDYRQQRMEESDDCDALMQEIIELWSPTGQMSQLASEDFSFRSLEVVPLDADKLYSSNVYLSIVRLTYYDTLDRVSP
ncbi:MAG: hypothetical protein AAF802_01820 [Planctomycetota bacterium]